MVRPVDRLVLVAILLSLVSCGAPVTETPDVVATEVAVARAVAATLTAEAPATAADLVATQVAAARNAVATLTADVPAATATVPPAEGLEPRGGRELGQGLTLAMQEIRDDDQAEFAYHAWTPVLMGPEQPASRDFNRAVDGFLEYALDEFRRGVVEVADEPGSTLWITHTVTAATGDLVSVVFYVDGYVMGAAHPFHYSYALNYALDQAKILGLDELFLPGTGYLELLSSYSLDELSRRGVLEWDDGALPAPENYQRWNITPDGLLISFDEYTVAAYAAGSQSVVVPYAVLQEFLDPEGPLAPFVP
jgi:hypothetical protein